MQKLIQVEEARALMNEAKDWGLWQWLWEKRRVRATADRAVDALTEAEKKVKAGWNNDLKKAYRELEALASLNGNLKSKRLYEKAKDEARDIDAEIKRAAQRVKEADDAAYNARMDAEDTFDEAERRLDTDMAREGAQKALDSWDLREKAIRKAEALGRKK
jgi:multidrug resistance efflux pump